MPTSAYLLFTLPATGPPTFLVLTSEQLVALHVDLQDSLELAERALLQALDAGCLDLSLLTHTFIQAVQLLRQDAAQLRVGKRELAAGLVHAAYIWIVLAELGRRVGDHTFVAEQVRVFALDHLVLRRHQRCVVEGIFREKSSQMGTP